MPAEHVGDQGHADQNSRKLQRIPPRIPCKQQCVGGLVDGEAETRNEHEAKRGSQERSAVAAKGQPVVANKGDDHGDDPACQVGRQGLPSKRLHEANHHAPVQGCSATAHRNEEQDVMDPTEAGERTLEQAIGGHRPHRAPEHSRVCVCVDDFGLTDGIGDAALQLIDMQRVQAIGCMVGAPAWSVWSGQARRLDAGAVDVGLHLDLTEFTLQPTTRMDLPQWIVRSYLGQLDTGAVRAEIRAQLGAFEDAVGRPPAYVDGHQHVHQLPGVRRELVDELLARYGGGSSPRPWLRATIAAAGLHPASHGGWRRWAKAHVIACLGHRGMRSLARAHGFLQNAGLLGVYGFDADAPGYFSLLAAGLGASRDATLLMCHPSRSHDAFDAIGAARRIEFEVLHGPQMGRLLAESGVCLQPMGRILARGRAPD